jgi:Uma2 family endonuclease
MRVWIDHPERIVYPETDGKPMGENTVQQRCIVALFNGFDALFADRPDVFVASDLFWYPRQGDPTCVRAPDVMFVFGRPPGDRPSYKQWEEGGIAPQVAIEVVSPSNTPDDRAEARLFYRRHGVEEFYEYHPETHVLRAWVRDGRRFARVRDLTGFVSPRLGVRFDAPGGRPMQVVRPDGTRFRSYRELLADAEQERKRAEREQMQAAAERAAKDRLAAKLRELGIDPDAV